MTYLTVGEDKRWTAVGESQLWGVWRNNLGSPSPTPQLAELRVHADKCTVPGLQKVRQLGSAPPKILLLCCESSSLGCELDNLAFQCLNFCLQCV